MVEWDRDAAGPNPPVLVVGGEYQTAFDQPLQGISTWNGQQFGDIGGGLQPWAIGRPARAYSALVLPDNRLVVGGYFFSAGGNTSANNIAIFDPASSTWSPMGEQFNTPLDFVTALARLPDGRIVAGGYSVSLAGDDADVVSLVVVWDGTNWSPLGGKFYDYVQSDTPIRSLSVLSNGQLVAAGDFDAIGTNFSTAPVRSNIARWTGTTWAALGAGLDAPAWATTFRNGQLYLGGEFTTAGALTVPSIARWNGSAWGQVVTDPTVQISRVVGLTTAQNGDLIVRGDVSINGGDPGYARLSGTQTWQPLTTNTFELHENQPVQLTPAITMSDGRIFISEYGYFAGLKELVGTQFQHLGVGFQWGGNYFESPPAPQRTWYGIQSFARASDGSLYATGIFDTLARKPAWSVAVRRSGAWQTLPSPQGLAYVSAVRSSLALPNGDLLIGINGDPAGVMRWNGSTWSTLGSFSTGPFAGGQVWSLARSPSGDVIAAGNFERADGQVVNNIARWTGTNWVGLGSGLTSASGPFVTTVYSVAFRPNGRIVVGGQFDTAGGLPVNGVAEWDGSAWVAVPSTPENRVVSAIAVLPNGDLLAGGTTDNPAGSNYPGIMRLSGTTWSPFAGGISPQFDGSAEQSIGAVKSIAVLPNGDVVIGGRFGAAGGVAAKNLARWNGTAWSAYGQGLAITNVPFGVVPPSSRVDAVLALPDGSLAIGGNFLEADGQTSSMFAIFGCEQAASCYANCDGSTTTPALTPSDFSCFLGRYRAGDPYANCDGSTITPVLTPSDFSCFLGRYRAGCP